MTLQKKNKRNISQDAHIIITLDDRDDSTTRIAFYYISCINGSTIYNVDTWYLYFMPVIALTLQLTWALFTGITGIIIYYFPVRITV